jgi:[acyl-carrier-protein] S-malonyltransferase
MATPAPITAFLFPGQGSQLVGMGKQLAARFPAAAAVFAQADEILGLPLSRLCWDGPAEELDDTVNTQPALLTHSIAVLRTLQAEFPRHRPAITAGHSMGEYSALVCSGVLDFPDALRLVRARGEAMQAAGQLAPGGMAAVLGMETEIVVEACGQASRECGEPVQLANDNCPGQLVISGSEKALSRALELLKDRGARRLIRLAVSIAAHSPLMQAGQRQFDQALESTPLRDPAIPILGNVSAAPLGRVEDIRQELRAQLTSQVRWTETIQAMAAQGVTAFLELGPKDVLTRLVGRIAPGLATRSLDEPGSLEGLSEWPAQP